jgi:hypothetical protein
MKPQTIETGHDAVKRGQLKRLLRAANSNIRQKIGFRPVVTVKPGPFDVEPQAIGASQTLVTALLVIYPVAGSVAAILAGLYLVGSGPL